jgi:hypothetical protein
LQEVIIKVHANNDRNKTTFFMVFIIISMSKGMLKYAIIKEKHKNSDDGCEKKRILIDSCRKENNKILCS